MLAGRGLVTFGAGSARRPGTAGAYRTNRPAAGAAAAAGPVPFSRQVPEELVLEVDEPAEMAEPDQDGFEGDLGVGGEPQPAFAGLQGLEIPEQPSSAGLFGLVSSAARSASADNEQDLLGRPSVLTIEEVAEMLDQLLVERRGGRSPTSMTLFAQGKDPARLLLRSRPRRSRTEGRG